MRHEYIKKYQSKKTAYVIVHPDDFALIIGKMSFTPDEYKSNLKFKVRKLINNKMKIIVLNLVRNKYDLPDFLNEFHSYIISIQFPLLMMILAKLNL